MTTLTDAQIADYRALSGDADTGAQDVTDAQIQAFYDAAVAASSDTDIIEARVIVQILRRCLGMARKKIDVFGVTQNGEKRSQLFTHIKDELLPYWEARAGMSGGGVIGVTSLNIDLYYDDDDFSAEATSEL